LAPLLAPSPRWGEMRELSAGVGAR
jgi:hypothetical protein